MDIIHEFLKDREVRVKNQEMLLKNYKGKILITIRINYPGIEKSNYITDNIVDIIYNEIYTYYKNYIVYNNRYKNKEGLIYNIVMDMDIITVKKLMIQIEEKHILGRCVDIDVYEYKDQGIIGISRLDLNKNPRKCFICELDAKICSRAKTHSIDNIKKFFEVAYKKYQEKSNHIDSLSYDLSQISLKAMISEVSTFPSFGLVSPINNGSHRDMNYYTFLDSSIAIVPYLKEIAKISYTYVESKYLFESIRKIGVKCEEKMFKATNGVNTHKGMIFLMGICISATMKAIYQNKDFYYIQYIIQEMCSDILLDFSNLKDKKYLTHGEKLYLRYGFTGIRGQVKDGLSIIFHNIIDKFENTNLNENDLYTQILIELISVVEDSTIVHRNDINTLRKVQEDAIELLNIGGVKTLQGKNKIKQLECEYINNNISPGGSADLLAVSIFLRDTKKIYKYLL